MKKTMLLALIAGALLVVVVGVLRDRIHPEEARMEKVIASFMGALPKDLTTAQRDEVREILENFRLRTRRGKVAPRDRSQVLDLLEHYAEKGSITKSELQTLMAKVSYYSLRLTPQYGREDESPPRPDHPLLEKGKGH